jgi:circadian clock protein KaiC
VNRTSESQTHVAGINKAKTGISGLDEITHGGLPQGRPTLVCGSAGCGKTMLAMEFLVRGATQYNEPGVFMAFEETELELTQNAASLGFDLGKLVEQKKLKLDYVHVEASEIEETGEYDLEGLFLRLGFAIDSIGAKRVVLDTIENLFSGFTNIAIVRSELRRLFRWLKDKGVTAIITGERGDGTLTRSGLEEYVSDCVIFLDHRVYDQVSTRRLRIVKYRGTTHGTNEYPFLIDENGISVLPITSMGLRHAASNERVSSGIERLDEMLGGKGYYRGSSILVSGTAGSGKSSVAAHFARATCQSGKKCLYTSFEESPDQIIRNMRSIGVDLKPFIDAGLLQIHSTRANAHGLEMHLVVFHKLIKEFQPDVVIVDPISGMMHSGTEMDANWMATRLIDLLKVKQITTMFVNLVGGESEREATSMAISSLIDTWLLLRDVELGGERNRVMYILKSRGMSHSNQLREFLITSNGIKLQDVYIGPEGVLTGSMRQAQEDREKAAAIAAQETLNKRQRELDRKREEMEQKIAQLRKDFEADVSETEAMIAVETRKASAIVDNRDRMATSRKTDQDSPNTQSKQSKK